MKAIILELIQIHGPIKRNDLLMKTGSKMLNQDLDNRVKVRNLINDRTMRKLIEQLIRDGHVIASSKKGYSIVTNVRELTEAVEYLKAPLRSASIRANTLIGNYNQKYQDAPAHLQFKLF